MRFRKASLWVKIVILAVLVCATATLVHLQKQINEVKTENLTIADQINAKTQENEKLAADVDGLQTYVNEKNSKAESAGETANEMEIAGSVDSDAMEELAREQGYVEPDEIVFEDVNN